jgi:hypothetical protein
MRFRLDITGLRHDGIDGDSYRSHTGAYHGAL